MKEEKINPKSILLLEDVEARALKYENSFYELSPNTKVLPFSKGKDFKFENEFPEKNIIYIRHPFVRGLYLLQNTDMEKVQIDKMNKFSILCRILGAHRFAVTKIFKGQKSFEVGAKARYYVEVEAKKEEVVEVKAGQNISAQGRYNDELSEYSEYQLENVYHIDNELDFHQSYSNALEYAVENGLSQDEGIISLIEKRNPFHGINSLLKSEKLIVNVSKEISNSIEASLQLNFFAKLNAIPLNTSGSFNSGFDIEAKMEVLKKESLKFELKIEF